MSWTNICIVEREKIIEIAENRYCGKVVTQKTFRNLKKICGAEFYQNPAKKNDRSDGSSGCW